MEIEAIPRGLKLGSEASKIRSYEPFGVPPYLSSNESYGCQRLNDRTNHQTSSYPAPLMPVMIQWNYDRFHRRIELPRVFAKSFREFNSPGVVIIRSRNRILPFFNPSGVDPPVSGCSAGEVRIDFLGRTFVPLESNKQHRFRTERQRADKSSPGFSAWTRASRLSSKACRMPN